MKQADSIPGDDPGFWGEAWQQVRLVYYLLRDPEVPIYLKALPFAAVLYVLFPFDVLPDVAPVVGQLDDITIFLVGAKVFIELAPPHIVARHQAAIRSRDGQGPVVEGEVVEVNDEDASLQKSIKLSADEDA